MNFYRIEIWQFNSLRIRENFNSLEEAIARYKEWPWPICKDNCSSGIEQIIPVDLIAMEVY